MKSIVRSTVDGQRGGRGDAGGEGGLHLACLVVLDDASAEDGAARSRTPARAMWAPRIRNPSPRAPRALGCSPPRGDRRPTPSTLSVTRLGLIWHRNADFELMYIILSANGCPRRPQRAARAAASGGRPRGRRAPTPVVVSARAPRRPRRRSSRSTHASPGSRSGATGSRCTAATARRAQAERQFLVAEAGGRVVGFVIGEVRDWEFGSPPCGWVFGIDVRSRSAPGRRRHAPAAGDLRRLPPRRRAQGAHDALARQQPVLSFFRSQGMMAGPFIPLEMDLER